LVQQVIYLLYNIYSPRIAPVIEDSLGAERLPLGIGDTPGTKRLATPIDNTPNTIFIKEANRRARSVIIVTN